MLKRKFTLAVTILKTNFGSCAYSQFLEKMYGIYKNLHGTFLENVSGNKESDFDHKLTIFF